MDKLCELIWDDNDDGRIYYFINKNRSQINNWNSRGQTALYIAFRKANILIANFLIDNGALISQLNRDASSPVTGFLWEFIHYESLNPKYIQFNNYFEKIISNSCDRKLIINGLNKLEIEYERFGKAPTYDKKYPYFNLQIIGKYKTINGVQGYYLYNNTLSTLQFYSLIKDLSGPLVNNELCYKFESKFILDKLNNDIFTKCLEKTNNYNITNIPKIYITNGIATDIANKRNNNHYFVLPSQLNGAEYTSHTKIVTEFEDYIYDQTAGPAGQLAVYAGVGQFILDNALNDNNLNGINAMKLILDKQNEIKLINGYLQVPESEQNSAKIIKQNIRDLITICMKNIPVKGYDQLNECEINADHNVNLIYCSAIPINSYTNPYSNANLVEVANAVLVGEYFGALKLAYKRGVQTQIKQVIHLSLLGSGVFKNKRENIAQSIIQAIYALEQFYYDINLFLEIRLQIFRDKDIAFHYENIFKKSKY